MLKKSISILLLVCFLVSFGAITSEAAYPEKPINLVVSWSAGGGSDIYAKYESLLITQSFKIIFWSTKANICFTIWPKRYIILQQKLFSCNAAVFFSNTSNTQTKNSI